MPESATGTTADALHGPYAGLDLDSLVDWPVVRTWLYWGISKFTADVRAYGQSATISGMFNYLRLSWDASGADIRATSPGACQRRHHGCVFGPVHRRMLLSGAASMRRAGGIQSLRRAGRLGVEPSSWPPGCSRLPLVQSRSRRAGEPSRCSHEIPCAICTVIATLQFLTTIGRRLDPYRSMYHSGI